ncbi:MAG: metal ABC transporter permease [Spirochaetaceae bacterium]|nr:metal ABC transporter permease [Spirochaetaceae bacterium]
MSYLPSWEQVVRVLLLSDFNTRVVVLGVALLGMAAGIVGTFTLLRKRALVSDAVSHATLPGIAAAWLVMVALGGTGKWFPGLLLGAAAGGLVAVGAVLTLRSVLRLHEDAALGVVLSVSFGIGIALLGLIQQMRRGSAAGLDSFIYGKTASMLSADALLIAVISLVLVVAAVLLFKELNLLCFDAPYAATQGFPVAFLDALMLALVVAVTVIGLQAVGLILIVALLITPAAAARFWTHDLRAMTVLAALLGASGGFVGAGLSALVPRLPAGAVIVVTTSVGFVISVLFGTRRGLLRVLVERHRGDRRIRREHLLRALFEQLEGQLGAMPGVRELAAMPVSRGQLARRRGWSRAELVSALRGARREGWLRPESATRQDLRLSAAGAERALQVVRNHRLWELYLIRYADVATSRVDRGADRIEHVLGPELVAELEEQLDRQRDRAAVAASPHELAGVAPPLPGVAAGAPAGLTRPS